MPDTEIRSELTATVWKVEVEVGASVAEGDTLLILESMKMEIPVAAPCGGVVKSLDVIEAQAVSEGDRLAVLEG